MSWLSVLVHKATGIPEINLNNNPVAAAVIDPLVTSLESEIVTNKLPDLLDQIPMAERLELLSAVSASVARGQAASTTPVTTTAPGA